MKDPFVGMAGEALRSRIGDPHIEIDTDEGGVLWTYFWHESDESGGRVIPFKEVLEGRTRAKTITGATVVGGKWILTLRDGVVTNVDEFEFEEPIFTQNLSLTSGSEGDEVPGADR